MAAPCIVPIARGTNIEYASERLIIRTNGVRENDRRDVIRLTFELRVFIQAEE